MFIDFLEENRLDANTISLLLLGAFLLSAANCFFWQFRFRGLLREHNLLENMHIGFKQGKYWASALRGDYRGIDVRLRSTAVKEIASYFIVFGVGIFYAMWGMNQG